MFTFNFVPPGMMSPGQEVRVSMTFTYNDPNIYELEDVHTFFEI